MTSQDIARILSAVLAMLVDDEAAVHVHVAEGQESVLFEIQVAEADIGKVIGRGGKTLEALRLLVASTSRKIRKRAQIQPLGTYNKNAPNSDSDVWKNPK